MMNVAYASYNLFDIRTDEGVDGWMMVGEKIDTLTVSQQ